MRNLILFCFIFSLCSCNIGRRYCDKHFPLEHKDSTYVEAQWIHDTIPMPYEVISWDTVTLIPPNIEIHHSTHKGGLIASIDISKGKLTYKCETDSLTCIIDSLKQITSYHNVTDTKMIICDKRHHSGWDSFTNYFTIFFILIAFIWVVIKAFR